MCNDTAAPSRRKVGARREEMARGDAPQCLGALKWGLGSICLDRSTPKQTRRMSYPRRPSLFVNLALTTMAGFRQASIHTPKAPARGRCVVKP